MSLENHICPVLKIFLMAWIFPTIVLRRPGLVTLNAKCETVTWLWPAAEDVDKTPMRPLDSICVILDSNWVWLRVLIRTPIRNIDLVSGCYAILISSLGRRVSLGKPM